MSVKFHYTYSPTPAGQHLKPCRIVCFTFNGKLMELYIMVELRSWANFVLDSFFFVCCWSLVIKWCLESPLLCRLMCRFCRTFDAMANITGVQWVIHQKALAVCSHVTWRPDPPAVTGCLSVCLTWLNSGKFSVISVNSSPANCCYLVCMPSLSPLCASVHQPLTRAPSLPSAACSSAPLLIFSNQRTAILLLTCCWNSG